MASIAQVTVRFGADLHDFTTKMQRVHKEIFAMGRAMQTTGRNLTRNLTLPILGAGLASTKLAVDFDESMTKIETLVGVASNVVKGFREDVLSLAGRTGRAPEELADALFTVTSAGLRGAKAMEVLEMAAKGAAIGMGDAKPIANAVTSVMQAWGPETMSAAKAMDILTATVREGNLEASELAGSLGPVISIASQLGVSFEEVGANIATFTRLGVDSAESVTALKGVLNGLLKPTKEGADALAKVGTSYAQLRKEVTEKGLHKVLIKLVKTFEGNEEALSDVIPNVRALSGVLGTAGRQSEEYTRIMDSMANSMGVTNEAFEKTAKSGAFQIKEALNEIRTIGTEIGSILLPVVADLAKSVKALFERFSGLSKETQTNIVKMALLAAAAGPVVLVVGNLITGVSKLIGTLRVLGGFINANPWFAVVGGILAALTALRGYNKASAAFNKNANSKAKAVKQEHDEVSSLVRTITSLNENNETRASLLDDLAKKYPDFLGKLDKEKVTNEELRNRLMEVNAEYVHKIALAAAEDRLTKNIQEQANALNAQKAALQEIDRLNQQLITSADKSEQTRLSGLIDSQQSIYDTLVIELQNLRDEAEQTTEQFEELARATLLKTDTKKDGQGRDTDKANTEIPLFDTADRVAEALPALQTMSDTLAGIQGHYIVASEAQESFFSRMNELSDFISDFGSNVMTGLGDIISGVFNDLLEGSKVTFGGIVKSIGKMIVKLLIATAAAAALRAILGDPSAAKDGANAASGIAVALQAVLSNFAGFRAMGGPVMAGRDYIVGEQGPELFRPSVSGQIVPNHALVGGGSARYQLQIVGNTTLRMQTDGSLAAMIRNDQIRLKKMGG